MQIEHPLDHFRYCPHCGSEDFRNHNVKSKRCSSCGFVYYLNPSAATAVLVTDLAGRLLVAVRKHPPAQGSYDLPGGFTDLNGETAEEGALRELREEVGIDPLGAHAHLVVKPLRYLCSEPNSYLYSGFAVPTMDLCFHLVVQSLDLFVGEGHDDVAELLALPISSLDPNCFGLPSIRRLVARFAMML